MLFSSDALPQQASNFFIQWTVVAKIIQADGQLSPGFAGAINGVFNNTFVLAGGANFPDKLPWEGGGKHYSDEIHVLHRNKGRFIWNTRVKAKLIAPVAYCGNTSTEQGIVYAGGENENGLSDKAYLLTFDPLKNQISIKSLPDLPVALTNVALTHIGAVVYAVGGDGKYNSSDSFLSLDLKSAKPEWLALPNLPIALANAVVVAQNGADGPHVYVVGGRTKTTSGISELHGTTLIYDPEKRSWTRGASIRDGLKETNFSAGAGLALGKHSILITGGDNGYVFHQIETYLAKIASTEIPEEKEKLIAEKNMLNINHNGFYRGILLYNTLTNRWTTLGKLPFPAQVTTTAVRWGNDIILSNGEVKPGVRTPNVMLGRFNNLNVW
ncbi:galactose oxidase [Pedobacter sp.]|uniref:galactose oxidase n=1 Tax=Pedobacter sp. TaxID=1411316 RepID=UPI002D7E2B49|nr:galactose oxidase [Pedobacter sp.]